MGNYEEVSTKMIPDYTGRRKHAETLAKRIRNYWRLRGYHNTNVWVNEQYLPSNPDAPIYTVRSDMKFHAQRPTPYGKE